jgi:hypothetical protein
MACESSGTVILSPTFEMGSYTAAIDFGGKELVILGSSAVFGAGGMGRLFYSVGGNNTSFELHNATLQDGSLANGYDTGGAVFAGDGANVGIYSSTFINNEAAGAGAAIFAYQRAHLQIRDSTFQSNQAIKLWGGAIRAENADVEIHNSVFKSNNCTHGGPVERGRGLGGAIFANSCNVKISASAFETNTAGGEGGAIYTGYGGGTSPPRSNVTIYDSVFKGNHAAGRGGAIIAGGFLEVFNSIFEGNIASQSGGAVFVGRQRLSEPSANATFTGCTFTANDVMKGHNDVTRYDNTSTVVFVCADGKGTPVTMQDGELELTNPPPASLKCGQHSPAPSPIPWTSIGITIGLCSLIGLVAIGARSRKRRGGMYGRERLLLEEGPPPSSTRLKYRNENADDGQLSTMSMASGEACCAACGEPFGNQPSLFCGDCGARRTDVLQEEGDAMARRMRR